MTTISDPRDRARGGAPTKSSRTPPTTRTGTSRTFSVDAEIPGLYPVTLFFHLVQPVTATVGRIVLGQGDDDYVTLGSAPARPSLPRWCGSPTRWKDW
jgi:hypothetical protein